MGLSLDLDTGRPVCRESVQGFLDAVDSFSEMDLLGPSRCHGWSRLDVVVHTIGGWHEMLAGLVCMVDTPPTVDAASFWTAFADEDSGEDPVLLTMSQLRRTAAFARPGAAVEQLHDVATAVQHGIEGLDGRPRRWLGQVFAPADFLAVWAVEHVIHQLDLLSDVPAPAGALEVARATVESLAGEPLPGSWTVEDAVLIGSGRLPVPGGDDTVGVRLPVLG